MLPAFTYGRGVYVIKLLVGRDLCMNRPPAPAPTPTSADGKKVALLWNDWGLELSDPLDRLDRVGLR